MFSDIADAFCHKPNGIETRWASPENFTAAKGEGGMTQDGRKGSAFFPLAPGESRTLLDIGGVPGTLRRIWATLDNRSAEVLRGLRLDMYWDGADRPAVSAPFGDFFGQGLGRCATFQSMLFSNPEGRSFNASVPMPFRNGCRVVLTNESSIALKSVFYDINFTVGDRHSDQTLYFHAHWRRENPTTRVRDYEFLPRVEGTGRLLGVTFGVRALSPGWWGEGEVKFYVDGDESHPTLCGTGTEDYIGTAWGQGVYSHLFQGCTVADAEAMQYCFYRFHVLDPVVFYRDLRATMAQLGVVGPTGARQALSEGRPLYRGRNTVNLQHIVDTGEASVFERQDDWSSCVYFYLDRPDNDLPALPPVAGRIAGLTTDKDATRRTDLQG